MKILFINIYQDIVARGSETFIIELAKRLAMNDEVKIISGGGTFVPPRSESCLTRPFLDKNGRTIAIFTIKKLPEIWKEKPDVVIPVNGGWQPAFIRILTWLRGGKMVISGQSGIGWDDLNNLWCFPDVFVALSSKALDWAKKANPFVKSVHISNGVDLDRFAPYNTKDNLRRPLKGDPYKVVLAVGAFTEQKRLDLVIKAVAKLKGVRLVIAGGGGDKKQEITDYGLKILGKKRFKIVSVPFEEMPEVYRAADVFTLPSAPTEAFGNVLVEAMASNLPVVATDDPIRKEIVGDAGILVDPTRTEDYAKAIKEALERDWGKRPRKQAEKFDWDKIAERYEELFQTLTK